MKRIKVCWLFSLCLLSGLFCPPFLPAQDIGISFSSEFTGDQLYEQGCNFCNQEKYQEAISCFEEAVKRKSNFAEAYYQLGICYLKTKQFEKAKQNLSFAKILSQDKKTKDEVAALLAKFPEEIEKEKGNKSKEKVMTIAEVVIPDSTNPQTTQIDSLSKPNNLEQEGGLELIQINNALKLAWDELQKARTSLLVEPEAGDEVLVLHDMTRGFMGGVFGKLLSKSEDQIIIEHAGVKEAFPLTMPDLLDKIRKKTEKKGIGYKIKVYNYENCERYRACAIEVAAKVNRYIQKYNARINAAVQNEVKTLNEEIGRRKHDTENIEWDKFLGQKVIIYFINYPEIEFRPVLLGGDICPNIDAESVELINLIDTTLNENVRVIWNLYYRKKNPETYTIVIDRLADKTTLYKLETEIKEGQLYRNKPFLKENGCQNSDGDKTVWSCITVGKLTSIDSNKRFVGLNPREQYFNPTGKGNMDLFVALRFGSIPMNAVARVELDKGQDIEFIDRQNKRTIKYDRESGKFVDKATNVDSDETTNKPREKW